MTQIDMSAPHRRQNALTGDWVLVSPQRAERPWLGQVEPERGAPVPAFDPSCYLCPGNARAGGVRNPAYDGTFVFDNDFPALLPERMPRLPGGQGLLSADPVTGVCRVVCFSPRHDLGLADMSEGEILRVVDTWAAQTEELGQSYRWVQVFENKGEVMGSSNPHPHGQIWASSALPNEPAKEEARQQAYRERFGRSLILDYAELEAANGERLVAANDDWLAVVPFWAVWPFETLLLPRFPVSRLHELGPRQRASLSAMLKGLLVRYDKLFGVSFPYSMGWHGAPQGSGAGEADYWQLHAHFYPPLLRSATVRKFMVGYELLAEPQRDLTPETAAERLRSLADVRDPEEPTGV